MSVRELKLEYEELAEELRSYKHCDHELLVDLHRSLSLHYQELMSYTRRAYTSSRPLEPLCFSRADRCDSEGVMGGHACVLEDNVDYPGDNCSSPPCLVFDLDVILDVASPAACCEACRQVSE